MGQLRQYVISVVAAAFVCGITLGLFPKGGCRELVKFVCGLFLALAVLHPLARFDFSRMTDLELLLTDDAAQAVAVGENLNREALCDIIKAETEAYILDKAAELDAPIQAEVTLSGTDTPVPVSVRLSGDVSPYVRQQLTRMMQEELGISKENQLWMP